MENTILASAFVYHLNADKPTWIFLFTYKHAANLLLFGLGHPFRHPENLYHAIYQPFQKLHQQKCQSQEKECTSANVCEANVADI
jgi:hypothetical protein